MAESPIRAVVFDLDGTLIDSRDDIAAAVNVALAACGYPELSTERISGYVGDGARLLVSRAASILPDAPEIEPLIDSFLDYYGAHATDRTRLVPEALAVLDALRSDFDLALLTNKPRRTTDVVLGALDLLPRFRVVVAGGDLPEKKPHPLPLCHIAERLGFVPRQLVMVGDAPQDVLTARAAGALSVGIEGGFASKEDLVASEPDVLLPTLGQLLPWLSAHATKR